MMEELSKSTPNYTKMIVDSANAVALAVDLLGTDPQKGMGDTWPLDAFKAVLSDMMGSRSGVSAQVQVNMPKLKSLAIDASVDGRIDAMNGIVGCVGDIEGVQRALNDRWKRKDNHRAMTPSPVARSDDDRAHEATAYMDRRIGSA